MQLKQTLLVAPLLITAAIGANVPLAARTYPSASGVSAVPYSGVSSSPYSAYSYYPEEYPNSESEPSSSRSQSAIISALDKVLQTASDLVEYLSSSSEDSEYEDEYSEDERYDNGLDENGDFELPTSNEENK